MEPKKPINLRSFDHLIGTRLKTSGPCVLDNCLGHDGRSTPARLAGDDPFTLREAVVKDLPEGGQIILFRLVPDTSPKPFRYASVTATGLHRYFELGKSTEVDFFDQLASACEKALTAEAEETPGTVDRPAGWGAWA